MKSLDPKQTDRRSESSYERSHGRLASPRRVALLLLLALGLSLPRQTSAATGQPAQLTASLTEYASKPAFYVSWSQFGRAYTESKLLTTLHSISNLNLTAFYDPFVIIVDGGWAASNRDSQRRLRFNQLLFPSGTNIIRTIHDYGCKGILWVERNGVYTTPSTGTPSTSGTNIQFDAQTIAGWGFDGAKFDIVGAETGQQKIALVTRFVNAFRSVATNRPTYFYHDVEGGMDRDDFSKFPPGCVICENSENDPEDILHWTETMMTHLDNVNGKNHWSCGREVYESWVSPHPKPYNTSFLKVWSMLGSPFVFTAVTGAEHRPSYSNIYHKRECIALNNDPLYAPPVPLFHTSTNLALKRLRNDGTITALAFNMTTNHTQSFTLTFDQLGLPSGQPAFIRDIYSETNCGKFHDSFSFSLAPMQSALLNFDHEPGKPILDITTPGTTEHRIGVNGRPGQKIVLQSSTNLQTWLPLTTNVLVTNRWVYTNKPASWRSKQYYRGVWP